jgi:SAM-dependent methyltransferase
MTEKSYNEFYNEEYRKLYTGVAANAANFFKAQNNRGRRLLDYLTTHGLVPASSENPPFVLEIGCGAGGILNYFRNQGYQVKGIDLGEEYLSYGKNEHQLDLEVGTLATLKLSTKPDLVIYSHVLEHVLDLNLELELLKSILDSDTLVYVEVPGLKNLASGYRNDPLRYFQNAHTFSFSKTSLGNLFAKHNFEMLQGNEFVKAVFKMSDTEVKEFTNDFKSIIAFLEKAESARKYYFISYARMKMVMDAVVDRMGKVFN